jgi:nucleoside-diphosphate-sugar epimerase
MAKILITGALGHIGSRFIRAIPAGRFSEVVLLDNLSTQRYCSLFDLPADIPYRFVEGDVCDMDLVGLFSGVDAVLHLAAITNAAGSFEIQEDVERVNFDGTQRVAKACAQIGSKLIFLSTTSVYGTQETVVDESCSIEQLKPQSPYATSKLRAENLLREMGAKEHLRYIVCRFGTIFGTSIGMRFHTAVNKFVWQACMGLPLTVWTTALHQKRPYLDLDDAVAAINFILDGDIFPNDIYNVLTLNATVNDICEAIRVHVPGLQIKFVEEKIMNQLSYDVACEKFKKLGFTFRGDLQRSIAQSVALLRNARSAG